MPGTDQRPEVIGHTSGLPRFQGQKTRNDEDTVCRCDRNNHLGKDGLIKVLYSFYGAQNSAYEHAV